MAEVLLFHHIQGLTDGVRAFADELRAVGHVIHTPDLFRGQTFSSIEDGFGFAKSVGFGVLRERGMAAASGLGTDLVYAGFSFGVTIAQALAQTQPGARGALLFYSCMPVTEFGEEWPEGVPVQIHGKEGDEFFDEDLPAARAPCGRPAALAREGCHVPAARHLHQHGAGRQPHPQGLEHLVRQAGAAGWR